jgi:hypothetical protein
MRSISRRLSLLAGITLLLIAGCSDGGLHTVPVYGQVTIAGRGFPKVCRIFFLPVTSEGPKRPSMAETTEDGKYAVKSFKDSEGLLPGSYKVNLTYYDLKPGADPALDGSWIIQDYDAGELAVDADSDGIEHNITVPAKS